MTFEEHLMDEIARVSNLIKSKQHEDIRQLQPTTERRV